MAKRSIAIHMITQSFTLPATAPFRLDFTAWALRRRERNQIDHWQGHRYVRIYTLDNTAVHVQVEQPDEKPQIRVLATSKTEIPHLKSRLTEILNGSLGLKADLTKFYDQFKNDPFLYPLIEKFKGVKPPRFPSIFEALANAVACQQISLEAGLSVLNNFTKRYGREFQTPDGIYHAFPEPSAIVKCEEDELMKLGFSRAKSATLIRLAAIPFPNIENMDNAAVMKLLTSIKGIGRWSAEYVLLRGLGRLEIIPGDDIGAQKNLKRVLNLQDALSYSQMKELEKGWSPFAGMIYFHLLLQNLSGFIS